jgi:hypothetical protein
MKDNLPGPSQVVVVVMGTGEGWMKTLLKLRGGEKGTDDELALLHAFTGISKPNMNLANSTVFIPCYSMYL